jgi:hypothetical protein
MAIEPASGLVDRRCVGLDLGKRSDPTALALLEWRSLSRDFGEVQSRHPDYNVRTLKRWPLGTAYTAIVSQVVRFFETPELRGATLVVDATGVGIAVVESIEEAMRGALGSVFTLMCVTITGGEEARFVGQGRWNVPKRVLVSVLQVLLGTRRLHISPGLPERKTLAHELQNFKVKVTQAGNETFEAWRERDHDDAVLAVALSCWAAELANRGLPRIDGPLVTSAIDPASFKSALPAPPTTWLTRGSQKQPPNPFGPVQPALPREKSILERVADENPALRRWLDDDS